jgi:adenylate cyclase
VREEVEGKLILSMEDRGEVALKNMPRPIRIFRIIPSGGQRQSRGRGTAEALALASKHSIAVLPFDNLSGDPEQQYFADGVAEDLITELSRFRALFVIARNSSFAFRGQQIDVAEIARRLAVRYLVEGSLRRVGNRVRITVQLIDGSTGAHLWADRYDRDLEDIFAVQDEVVRTVVATVAGRLEAAGAELAKRKPPESLIAYDYVLRGVEQLNLVGDQHNAEARHLFEKAVELDQQYAASHAYLALAIFVEWQINRDPGELERALASARRAVALDDNDSRCHRILSTIYTHLREFDRAEFHSDRSIALNPNDAQAALSRAGLLQRLGRAEEGIEWGRKAMQLNPYHPNWYWETLGKVLHSAGHYAEALDAYSRIVGRPSFYHAYVAACHAELGQMDEARKHAALALQAKPDFSVTAWGTRLPFKHETDLQRFLAGLRKAGLPE